MSWADLISRLLSVVWGQAVGGESLGEAIVAVANGASYSEAARSMGGQSGDGVSQLVSRFNQEGLAALEPRHGGGAKVIYDREKRQAILQTLGSAPELEREGTGHWSLSTLQRHLRQQPAFATVSTYTLWRVLHEADWSWQSSRSWCQTAQVKRRRKSGIVTVTDPDSQAKKS